MLFTPYKITHFIQSCIIFPFSVSATPFARDSVTFVVFFLSFSTRFFFSLFVHFFVCFTTNTVKFTLIISAGNSQLPPTHTSKHATPKTQRFASKHPDFFTQFGTISYHDIYTFNNAYNSIHPLASDYKHYRDTNRRTRRRTSWTHSRNSEGTSIVD